MLCETFESYDQEQDMPKVNDMLIIDNYANNSDSDNDDYIVEIDYEEYLKSSYQGQV